jgi:hemolysin activation/secretion protein
VPTKNWEGPVWRPALLAAVAALAFSAAQQARAQAGITPGRVLDTLPASKPALPPTPAEVVFPAPLPFVKHDPNAPRFSVHAFTFTGNTVFSDAVLKLRLERFVDLQLNLYDLTRAADAITRFYRERGYPIARAIVPAQTVEKGVVRIEVIEGRIGKISVVGNERYSDATLLGYAGSLPREGLVTLEGLERGLLLMNDLPGLTARATLQAGAEFGTTDVLVRAEEQRASGFVSIDNRGREEVGQRRLDASLELHNPLGYGDELGVRAIRSEDDLLSYGRIGYGFPLGSSGLRGTAIYSRTDYTIGGDFAALGIEGDSNTRELALSYPALRSRRRNVVLGLGWRRTESNQTTLGVLTTADRIGLLNANVLGNWVHEDSAVTNATVIVSGNGRRNPFGQRQDAQAAKLEIDLNHLRAASRNWDLYLRGNMVVSRDPLADTEKFALGGPDSVRGYQASELRGDQGRQATVELRRQFQAAGTPGVAHLFYDYGTAKAKGFPGADSIQSWGIGATVFLHRHLRAKVEYAHPISDFRSADGERDRIWFTVTAAF